MNASFPFNRRQLLLTGLAAGGLYLLGGRIALADGEVGLAALEAGGDLIADKIIKFLDQENRGKVVAVADWNASAHLISSGGKAVTESVAKAFKKKGLTVSPDAELQVGGSFTTVDDWLFRDEEKKPLPPDQNINAVALKVRAEVLTKQLERLHEFSILVHGSAILQVVGATIDLPPQMPEQQRQDRIRDIVAKPSEHGSATIVGNETRASAESPYAVEVRVNSAARRPELEGGRPYVSLRKSEEYTLVLRNRSPHEAAVTVTIDGLSMFAFSEEGNFGSQIVVPPNSAYEIPGWYLTGAKSARFLVTDYPSSAAGKKGVTSGVGMIACTFHACWPRDVEPPADEGASRGVATGLGQKVDAKYVQVRRTIGRPRATVAVRYDR